MDVSTRERSEALLFKAGHAYGIKASHEDLVRALDDPDHGPAFAEWATTHLAPENLLGVEELSLYTALDASGQVDRLAGLYDLAEVQPVDPADLAAATQMLQKCTASIQDQTQALRQQHDALSRLVKDAAEGEARRQALDRRRRRDRDTERKMVAAEIDQLLQSLQSRVSDLEQNSEASESALRQTVDGVLRGDDKLLSSLQKLGRELAPHGPDEVQAVDKLRELCLRLIKITVERVRAKLDTVYLEALAAAAQESHHDSLIGEKDVKVVEEEVESLYAEVLPVAQMTVEQQYLEPALKLTAARSGHGITRSSAAMKYIGDSLDYLLQRMDKLLDSTQNLNSHKIATASILAIAKEEISAHITSRQPISETRPVSPVRPERNGPRVKPHSDGVPAVPPVEMALQHLGIDLEDGPPQVQVASLCKILGERSRKADDVARSTQESFESNANAYLEDAKVAVQLLMDSLLAESPFGNIQMVDGEFDRSVEALHNDVAQVTERLARVESDRAGESSNKKDDFLQRWAR